MRTLWLILLSDVFYIVKSYGKIKTIGLLTGFFFFAGPLKHIGDLKLFWFCQRGARNKINHDTFRENNMMLCILVLYQLYAKTSFQLNWEIELIHVVRGYPRILFQSSVSNKKKECAYTLFWICFKHELKRSFFIILLFQQWEKWRNQLKIRYLIPSLISKMIFIHTACINKGNSLNSDRFIV